MAEQQDIVDLGSAPMTEDRQFESAPKSEARDETAAKREREEKDEEDNAEVSKKQKVEEEDKCAEEERLEKENVSGRVKLGPKEFTSSVEMFDYFGNFVRFWPVDLEINKYEHRVLQDLIKKGHPEPERKVGGGIKAFQIKNHPMWKSRCFFLIREDGTTDDFSFRKCVDHILPLPENMRAPKSSNSHGDRRGGPGGRRGGPGGRRGGPGGRRGRK